MNTHTLNARQLRGLAAALFTIVLVGAASPVVSAAHSDQLRLACQGSTSCGG